MKTLSAIKNISIFVLLFISIITKGQVLTTEPLIPVANKPLVIYFNSALEPGALKDYTEPLYAHTGLILAGDTKWQYVIESWGNNTTQPQLEYLGNKTYRLSVSPSLFSYYSAPTSVTIQKIAIVIRSADAKKQTADYFIDVFPEGLNVSFSIPEERSKVVELNQDVNVNANASGADSLALYRNGNFIKGMKMATSISHTFQANAYGENTIVVRAFASEESASDTFFYFVRPEPQIEVLPQGMKDGINYISGQSIVLSLYAPNKNYAFVLGDFSNWTAREATYMKRTPDGKRYWIQLDNLTPGKEYAYQYLVNGNILIADPYTEKILDPWNDEWISNSTYPNLKPYPKNLTTGIVSVFQTDQQGYSWKNTSFTNPPKEKLVIYELLLRDFIAAHDWKTLTDTLNYFTRLGINAIELMPFNEFEGNESWGYNPSFYFAPDKYYGPARDLKRFIDSCHSRGIAVIMDMVLNHSYGQSPLVQLYWDKTNNRPAPDNPWYNVNSPNPVYSWGYDFNHETQATKDFVDRVNSYWLTEYKLDGFRFDFTKGFTNTPGDGSTYDASRINILKRMADAIWQVRPDAYVILEHFAPNTEEKILADHGMMIWGNMNYAYTEASMGYNNNSDISGVSYKNRNWTFPHLVGYMESHDEERMMFKNGTYGAELGSYSVKNFATAMQRIELAAVFFIPVPGPKMIWQFGELAYDYSIDFNGRVGNKPIRWDYYPFRQRLFRVFAELNRLKTSQPAFSTSDYTILGAGALKRIELNHSDMDVRIIGNFDLKSASINPNFSKTGTWYDYFSGQQLNVSNTQATILLQPGEYRIYTSKYLIPPSLPSSLEPVFHGTEIKVYPNPANSWVRIESSTVLGRITLTDMSGRRIRDLDISDHSYTLDLAGFQPGIYLLSAGNSNSIFRLMKL